MEVQATFQPTYPDVAEQLLGTTSRKGTPGELRSCPKVAKQLLNRCSGSGTLAQIRPSSGPTLAQLGTDWPSLANLSHTGSTLLKLGKTCQNCWLNLAKCGQALAKSGNIWPGSVECGHFLLKLATFGHNVGKVRPILEPKLVQTLSSWSISSTTSGQHLDNWGAWLSHAEGLRPCAAPSEPRGSPPVVHSVTGLAHISLFRSLFPRVSTVRLVPVAHTGAWEAATSNKSDTCGARRVRHG